MKLFKSVIFSWLLISILLVSFLAISSLEINDSLDHQSTDFNQDKMSSVPLSAYHKHFYDVVSQESVFSFNIDPAMIGI